MSWSKRDMENKEMSMSLTHKVHKEAQEEVFAWGGRPFLSFDLQVMEKSSEVGWFSKIVPCRAETWGRDHGNAGAHAPADNEVDLGVWASWIDSWESLKYPPQELRRLQSTQLRLATSCCVPHLSSNCLYLSNELNPSFPGRYCGTEVSLMSSSLFRGKAG